jgi:gamma-glutamyltranspeptidase/glutathione hydrolase
MQHLEIEAMKLGIADVAEHVADEAAMALDARELLAPDYLDAQARLIKREQASTPGPGRLNGHETIYLAAADADGMMVSYIQSNFRGFGSGVVVPGTGIAMHNRGSGFVLKPGHPNHVGPRKRPFHTIIPSFATRGGAPVAAFGVMGGTMQPQGHVQLATRLFAKGQNPQAAIDGPRWRLEEGELTIEAAWQPSFRAALAARGHAPSEAGLFDFGAAQVIWRLGKQGYVAASESRRDGQAVGF